MTIYCDHNATTPLRAEVLEAMQGKPVVIRTVDLGADKMVGMEPAEPERNPFLGLRSIRLSLRHLPTFRTQLRAILRASLLGDVRIMFPLVSTVMELRTAKMVLADVCEDLEEHGLPCRRDVPMLARVAEAGSMELRILARDGQRFSTSHRPSLAEAPDSNADGRAEFLKEKNGQTWQSIPVAVFYTKDLEYLYHYTEFPAIYEKDRLVAGHIRQPRPGETKEATQSRADREFMALQQSPFFRIWASAAVDEIVSALHRRVVLGATA